MTAVAPAHVPHRTVEVRLLTSLGWMQGHVELLRIQGLREYLDSSPGVIKLQDARISARGQTAPFFAIQKSAVMFIVLLQQDDHLEGTSYAETRSHHVTCWMPAGVIEGHLELPIAVRLSDFLQHQPEFMTLTECLIRGANGEPLEKFPVLLVNARALIGISERENPPAEVFEVVDEAGARGDVS